MEFRCNAKPSVCVCVKNIQRCSSFRNRLFTQISFPSSYILFSLYFVKNMSLNMEIRSLVIITHSIESVNNAVRIGKENELNVIFLKARHAAPSLKTVFHAREIE